MIETCSAGELDSTHLALKETIPALTREEAPKSPESPGHSDLELPRADIEELLRGAPDSIQFAVAVCQRLSVGWAPEWLLIPEVQELVHEIDPELVQTHIMFRISTAGRQPWFRLYSLADMPTKDEMLFNCAEMSGWRPADGYNNALMSGDLLLYGSISLPDVDDWVGVYDLEPFGEEGIVHELTYVKYLVNDDEQQQLQDSSASPLRPPAEAAVAADALVEVLEVSKKEELSEVVEAASAPEAAEVETQEGWIPLQGQRAGGDNDNAPAEVEMLATLRAWGWRTIQQLRDPKFREQVMTEMDPSFLEEHLMLSIDVVHHHGGESVCKLHMLCDTSDLIPKEDIMYSCAQLLESFAGISAAEAVSRGDCELLLADSAMPLQDVAAWDLECGLAPMGEEGLVHKLTFVVRSVP
eukprot:CAMPEP_0178438420 /NCGR_PEP_ID=MMETSP0689_2-20121128/35583_1 /TAXON_ID=160604 /ORGANISM="Amphidinium massartii, Strain CS-259" /LENGTH=411 /DNA_ID=CAMNT_0020060821 /DNA_START=150 /DNA_END=1385 /DNA_ORIENTATION=-